MLANIAPMARRSAAVTAIAAVVMVAFSAGFGGQKGVIGAAIAVGLVAVFFGITALALGLASRVSPQATMLAGIGTYTVKIIVLLFLIGRFQNSTAFSAWVFGLTVIVLVLVYQSALIVMWRRTKMLYVEPDGER